MKWQSIETAPRDGTVVLALLSGSDVPQPVKWCTDVWVHQWDFYPLYRNTDRPIYWMPIPPAPETKV